MATLQKDPKAMRLAKNTFSQYCQSCHDKDGKGQTNFPNLTDQAWFWGGSEAQITQTITDYLVNLHHDNPHKLACILLGQLRVFPHQKYYQKYF
jgi:cbb3-type cytochrome c oxidase subunit III